ncbi:SagB family peptide dehydrogenase [Limnofasciculus baicalensis]|uniref:SagB family peptide dehydrogenase n=1 Tax=Limnofasciculus baicalensis BBK-W-15 TaxID=2699891 RepID=A0AAE3KPH1_9CYAN|nr:SagB family peptide dehydrogenase [Limnofasciculus baicalensis]MCP2730891.1 SagB family peptide dehydrogenase [Limnofasciculus baicalensis BBK-W-15]
MYNPFILSFKQGISVIEESSDRVIVQSPQVDLNIPEYTINIEPVSPGFLAALKLLATEGATEENLSELVLQTDSFSELPNLYYYLEKFINLGFVCHTVLAEELPMATLVPLGKYDKFQIKEATTDKKYVLSRFAYCRKNKEKLVLESPLSHSQLILVDLQSAALIAELSQPRDCREIYNKIPSLSEDTIKNLFSLLLSDEMLLAVEEDGTIAEETNETLVQWEFHDLLFHSRTRTGRHSNPVGRTYPFLGKIERLPAIKPKVSNDIINLYKPDIEKLKESDYPFSLILEDRKSIKQFNDANPITDKQIGEFLYRTARVKKVMEKGPEEISNRPYPNGGANYELELYLAVNICENIPDGFYHYCPQDHQLCKISDRTKNVDQLLEEIWITNRQHHTPQVLIIMAARFARINWQYESIAYAAILKNVGILLQTMYLVATAMNLGSCAIAQGNADLFALTAKTDYYAETSVGEFILGTK